MPLPKLNGRASRLPALFCLLALELSGCGATIPHPPPQSANQELLALFAQQGITVQEQGTGVVLVIPYVSFAYNKAALSAPAQSLLRVVATTLTRPPADQRAIAVDGHTDAAGSPDYNRTLSRARAEAVARLLIAGGVRKERVRVEEFGAAFPIAPNRTPEGKDNPAGRAQNRRVEVVILQPQPGVAGRR